MGKSDPIVVKPPTDLELAAIAKRKAAAVIWLTAAGFTAKAVEDIAAKKTLKGTLLELHKVDEASWRAAGGS